MPDIPINRMVGMKKNSQGKKWRAEEEKRNEGSPTQKQNKTLTLGYIG
jgi:hypothetical protein